MVKYEHQEKGAEFAANAIGFPLKKTIKTLVVDLGSKNYLLALVPGNKQLALKRLARICSVKRAAMADTETAQRITGYLVGGISPFGIRHALRAVMDESLPVYDRVAINAGQRGVMLIMAPADIIRVLKCGIFHITGDG